jgi:hypothetical protein
VSSSDYNFRGSWYFPFFSEVSLVSLENKKEELIIYKLSKGFDKKECLNYEI